MIAPERGEDYSVDVGFRSGSLNEEVEFDIDLNLITAGKFSCLDLQFVPRIFSMLA